MLISIKKWAQRKAAIAGLGSILVRIDGDKNSNPNGTAKGNREEFDKLFPGILIPGLTATEAELLCTQVNSLKEAIEETERNFPDETAENEDWQKIREHLEKLIELCRKIQEEKEKLKEIQEGLDVFDGTAEGDADSYETDRDEAREKAEEVIDQENQLVDLTNAAQEFLDKDSTTPEGEDVDTGGLTDPDQDPRDVGYDDRHGLSLEPGDCIVITFSPRVRDRWWDPDLRIKTNPPGTSITVEGKESSRDTNYDPTKLEKKDGSETDWEIKGGIVRKYRKIRICNNGRDKVVVTYVRSLSKGE